MSKQVCLMGTNIDIIPIEQAENDIDFLSFFKANKGNFNSFKYLAFFKTEAVHVGINGNGLRFFTSDLKQDKPFMYAPVKYEHGGPIVGTVVSGKYIKNDEGIGAIEVKGVIWLLEESTRSSYLLESIISNPEYCKVSMECMLDNADKCDYGIGNKKISYEKFLQLQDYCGSDYNGKGIVWRRANNPTFVGLAFTGNPADRNTDVEFFEQAEVDKLNLAYASMISSGEEEICPNCGHAIGKEDVTMATKKGKAVEEEVIEEEDEVEEEEELEEDEEVEEDEDVDDEDEDVEEYEEETEEEEVEEEEEEVEEEEVKTPPAKKKQVKSVKTKTNVSKKVRSPLKYRVDDVEKRLKEITEVLQNLQV